MPFPDDQFEELKQLYPGAASCDEGGVTYFYLPQLRLPDGCEPSQTDALLCPVERDGYRSRLYLAKMVQSKAPRNWNGSARILERNWVAFSWNIQRDDLRLAQIVAHHVGALR
jgi:hypothetical protein